MRLSRRWRVFGVKHTECLVGEAEGNDLANGIAVGMAEQKVPLFVAYDSGMRVAVHESEVRVTGG